MNETPMHTTSSIQDTAVRRCAVCRVDLRGRFVYVDDKVQDLLGYSMEELFARPVVDFVLELRVTV
jgi:PAS domain S-box-containing protein